MAAEFFRLFFSWYDEEWTKYPKEYQEAYAKNVSTPRLLLQSLPQAYFQRRLPDPKGRRGRFMAQAIQMALHGFWPGGN